MPVPRDRKSDNRDRRKEALRRLRISEEQLNAVSPITPLLKLADGGMPQVIAAMRMFEDPLIAQFLAKYDAVPVGDRERLPLEAIALAAGINANHLMGSTLAALQAQAVNMVKIIAMTSHPKITQARVVFGQMPSGEKDRAALDTAMGFLPSPKGPTFIGKAIFGSGKAVMDAQGGGDDDDELTAGDDEVDLDKLFPPANKMQEKLALIRQKMLNRPS
jgi:hypothetical protein